MIYFIIEEWVALTPAKVVKLVINSTLDEKLRHLYFKAIRANIESGYRPDLNNLLP